MWCPSFCYVNGQNVDTGKNLQSQVWKSFDSRTWSIHESLDYLKRTSV